MRLCTAVNEVDATVVSVRRSHCKLLGCTAQPHRVLVVVVDYYRVFE
jgi:hypothetical protein